MEGSTELYVYKLSQMFFGLLRSTCHEFGYLFDNSAKSGEMRVLKECMCTITGCLCRREGAEREWGLYNTWEVYAIACSHHLSSWNDYTLWISFSISGCFLRCTLPSIRAVGWAAALRVCWRFFQTSAWKYDSEPCHCCRLCQCCCSKLCCRE